MVSVDDWFCAVQQFSDLIAFGFHGIKLSKREAVAWWWTG